MSETQSVIETASTVTAGAVKTSVFGGIGTLVGKVTGLDPVTAIGLIIGIGGLFVSLISLCVNWYYKSKENQRKQELHDLESQQLRLEIKGRCHVED